jgi:DNA replication protein DnaC
MEPLNFVRSSALNNIPTKKLQDKLTTIQEGEDAQEAKIIKLIAINRYAESNIPIEYWGLSMEKDFTGDPRLKQKYEKYIADIKQSYIDGKSICFAGGYGLGKTMTGLSILKKACLKGYSCLYTDLSTIVSILTTSSFGDEKSIARRELTMVDFLMIDEVDQRYFKASDAANETFARTLEFVIRTRTSNNLPILMATNSPQIKETFANQFKDSLGSIMSKIEMFAIMPGPDFRKEG